MRAAPPAVNAALTLVAPLRPRVVHDEIRKQTTYEAADGEDGCDDREDEIGHGYACRQAIVSGVGGLDFACKHSLYLVEGRYVIAILRMTD